MTTPSPLTVLFTESSPNFGGQERRILFEARWLSNSGHVAEIACPPNSPLFARGREAGLKVYPVPIRGSLHPSGLVAMARVLARRKPDILYSHSGKDSWLAGICGLFAGIPLIRSRELLTPVRSSVAYNWLPRKVLTNSEAVKRQLLEAGVRPDKVFVHYPPVEIRRFNVINPEVRFSFRRKENLERKFPVIAHAGVFRSDKRQEDLIQAVKILASEFPSILLLFAGQGPDLEAVRLLAEKEGIAKHVRFLGEREDLPVILASSDLFAFPSVVEPFGMAPVEAMAAGLPVVAAKTGGLPEIIEDGVNGLLVPVMSPDRLAKAIARIIQDRNLWERLSSAGRTRAWFFDADKAMERLLAHFYEAINY